MVEPTGPINTVRKYIKAQRKLAVFCYYKTWETAEGLQHQFVVSRFSLGDKPYEESEQKGSSIPQLPSH